MPARICLASLTTLARCRITNWKMVTLSEFHFQARAPSRSTERGPENILPNFRTVRHIVGLAYIQVFFTYLATYHHLWLRNSDYFQYFGASNHSRPQIACSRLLGGGHSGGLTRALRQRCLRPQCGGCGGGSPVLGPEHTSHLAVACNNVRL